MKDNMENKRNNKKEKQKENKKHPYKNMRIRDNMLRSRSNICIKCGKRFFASSNKEKICEECENEE